MRLKKITIPGSKSITNRVLMLAALSKGKTRITNAAICDDTNFMIKGLKELGIKIEQKNTTIIITGDTFKKGKKIKIYTGNAGTATRFLTALATITENEVLINGNKRMQQRPIQELVKSLSSLGANIKSPSGCPPVFIKPAKIKGGKTKIPGNISSQYLSAIMMIASHSESPIQINIEQKLYSKPYISMTLKVMEAFKIKTLNKNFRQFRIPGSTRPVSPKKFQIEGDASSASYFGAYAALHPQQPVLLKNIFLNSIQGDINFLHYLKIMGCKIEKNPQGVIVIGPKKLKPLQSIDMNETPDLVMTFSILAMFTEGKTIIKNIANLRIKETDRITALQTEIQKLGIKVKTGKDFIEIFGNPSISPLPVKIETYDDHRIAMSFGIIQDIFPQIKIKNPKCVSKSYPTFWQDLNN